jgi:hypothetical protein
MDEHMQTIKARLEAIRERHAPPKGTIRYGTVDAQRVIGQEDVLWLLEALGVALEFIATCKVWHSEGENSMGDWSAFTSYEFDEDKLEALIAALGEGAEG